MDKRFFLFLILSVAIMSGYQLIIFSLYPPEPHQVAQQKEEKKGKEAGKDGNDKQQAVDADPGARRTAEGYSG